MLGACTPGARLSGFSRCRGFTVRIDGQEKVDMNVDHWGQRVVGYVQTLSLCSLLGAGNYQQDSFQL